MITIFKSLLATAIVLLGSQYVQAAETRHKTILDVRFGALQVGSATFEIRFDENTYDVSARGKTVGIAELFSSGRGKAVSKGHFEAEKVVVDENAVEFVEDKKTSSLVMAFADGNVASVVLNPVKKKKRLAPKYVPIEPSHLMSVIDPASSIVVRLSATEAANPKNACNRTIPIYDGDTRFDIALTYKFTKTVSTDGYNGDAYVCQLRYVPVSGHKTKQRNIEYMSGNRDMEIWLAPIGGTGIFSIIRVEVPTWVGTVTAVPTFFGTAGN